MSFNILMSIYYLILYFTHLFISLFFVSFLYLSFYLEYKQQIILEVILFSKLLIHIYNF